MSSILLHIKTAFTKISDASNKNKGCKLTYEEVYAINIHHAIPDAIGDYDQWEFDENGELIEED